MKTKYSLWALMLLAITSIALLPACSKKDKTAVYDEKIESLVSGLTFPQKLNDNSSLTACYYKDKLLTYRVEIDKDKLASMKVEEKRTETLDKLRTGLLPRALVQNLVKAEASLQYIYVNGTDSVGFVFTPEELKIAE